MATFKTKKKAQKKVRKLSATSAAAKKSKKAAKTLVIVESPAKARTINKYLGKQYLIEASLGHIIDLPKSRMAVDTENDFKPEYITVRGRAGVLMRLKKLAKASSAVLLAADPDREGEAIAWHLKRALEANNPAIQRIEFNEITKSALQKAISSPREINQNLVDAQQARRILDRLVGYNISPLLWKKVKAGLSAGRVQSVALKQICDREKAIEDFVEEEFWSLKARLNCSGAILEAELYSIDGVILNKQIQTEEAMSKIIASLKEETFTVLSISRRERQRAPTAPYTTSKLQQDAANHLSFSSQKSMMLAQQLYEGVALGKEGHTGLITYMRTDSKRTAPEAMAALRAFIPQEYGRDYLAKKQREYANKGGAQDAHEAVRPTDLRRKPADISAFLTRDQLRLYQLIWNKFVSSQMSNEISLYTTVQVHAVPKKRMIFRAVHRVISFPGFNILNPAKEKTKSKPLPVDKLQEGAVLQLKKLLPKQHFTQPPPRYTDATIVKLLEESGIGRPSTYAPTIQTLLRRYYVSRVQARALQPTELGHIVNRIMCQHFPHLVNTSFTAAMEKELDQIAASDSDWVHMLHAFYKPFKNTLQDAAQNIEDLKGSLDKPTEHLCEKCNSYMVKRLGRHGYFLACPRFPDCRNAKSLPLGPCSLCEEGFTIRRSTKKGRAFYGCSRYPECEFSTWDRPTDEICPACNKLLFQKQGFKKDAELFCLGCSHTAQSEHQSA